MKSETVIILSEQIVTPLELGKIQRELFALDNFLSAAGQKSSRGTKVPYLSPLLSVMVKQTGLNLLKEDDRKQFKKQLQFVRRTAPVVNISFASEPGKQALRHLVRWFRENVHPNTLINPSVVPGLGGGCIVNTSTKSFDFSLKKHFDKHKHSLAEML